MKTRSVYRSKLESRLGKPETAVGTYAWAAFGGFALAAIVLGVGVTHAVHANTDGLRLLGIALAITSLVPATLGISGVIGLREERKSPPD